VLERWKIGLAVALPFNQSRSLQEPSDFLAELATAFPSLQSISVGPNWRFGKNRSGDVPMLSVWCQKHSVTLDNPAPVLYEGERISSSRIRTRIQSGDLSQASAMLGRPFTILGKVGSGDGRGKDLGFPTANLETEDECLPPDGVYAGQAVLADGQRFCAAINLGNRPTFDGQSRKIEAHLPGFSGNLRGEEMDLEFYRWIRGEKKFTDATALAAQIRLDVQSVLEKSPDQAPPLA
jgi:riboflavin kinase/FMN adenylyltransferase